MANQVLCQPYGFHMENDLVPEGPIDTENLERDNHAAIRNIRAMGPDLWAVEEFERNILGGNDDPPLDAVPAGPSKS